MSMRRPAVTWSFRGRRVRSAGRRCRSVPAIGARPTGPAGDAGSEQVALAKKLLSDTETRIVYAQPDSELAVTAELLGLGDTQRATVGSLPRGVGLWKVGPTSHVVAHQFGSAEASVVDTDAGMYQPQDRQAAA